MKLLQTNYKLQINKLLLSWLVILLGLLPLNLVGATDYSSTNFKIKDPIIGGGGIDGSSANFQVLSAIGQTGEGEGTSSNYELRSGVLYFAELATPPVITSATVGEEKVTLVWSAASGNIAVDHYELGQATSSGAQTYTNIGSVLTTVATSLTGGTTYYFKIRAVDATGTVTATSSEVSATPTLVSSGGPGSPGGPGEGGGPVISPPLPIPDDTEEIPEEEEEEVVIPTAPTALGGEPINANTIRWSFLDNSDNEENFILKVGNSIVGGSAANSSFIDEAVSANTWHAGREVFAFNSAGTSAGSGFSGVHSYIENPTSLYAQTFGVPNALQLRAVSDNLVFTNLNQGQSALEFINTTQNTSSGWVKTDNIIVSGLATGRPYTFIVRARNAIGRVTNVSSPFTFSLPINQQPGQNIPNQTTPPKTPIDIDENVDENFELNIIYPENNLETSSDELEVLVATVPFAIVTLQVNITSATGLSDANGQARFTLQDLPPGRYLLTAIATAQSGVRSKATRQIFYITPSESNVGETSEILPTITPQAPETPPPPEIVQPPLTQAVIVSEIDLSSTTLSCGVWCHWLALAIAVYVLILLLIWYLVWWYINRPFLTKPKKRIKK